MQVDFYRLLRDPAAQVVSRLATRILDQRKRLLILAEDEHLLGSLSEALWAAGPDSFLANGRAGQGREALQPILLSTQPDPQNGADHILIADGLWRDEALARAERLFFLFDDSTIAAARDQWRTLSARGDIDLHFWKQDEDGRWLQGP